MDKNIFKSYDIRGIYPQSINEDIAYKIGYAYGDLFRPKGFVLVGHDVRIHSESLKNSLIKGLIDSGTNVLDVGWISTDMLYFGVGYYQLDGGITLTASHNPPEWHGAKMVRGGVTPMTLESGIGDIRDYIIKNRKFKKRKGAKLQKNSKILQDYKNYILTWFDSKKVIKHKVVINPNFGFAGIIFKNIIQTANLPLELVELNSNPDGTFPKGRPDPFIPENRTEFIDLVKKSGADLGIAWDADSDRVFFCADGGTFVMPYYLNTILIEKILQENPGEKIIYDIRYTWCLIDAIKKNKGIPILSRVGHSYIKENMRKENAILGVESSGHTYYREYWYSDCGMIPPFQVLEYLSVKNKKLSDIIFPLLNKYFASEEINSEVSDKDTKIQQISNHFKDGKQSFLDGICVEYPDFRFVVRPSNTEQLLRLTLEAKTPSLLETKQEEILRIIRS